MRQSWKILCSILALEACILGLAFWGFSIQLHKSRIQQEASIFDTTTNLQYSELLRDPENSAAESMVLTARHVSQMPGILGVSLFNERFENVLTVPDWFPSNPVNSLAPAAQAVLRESSMIVDDPIMSKAPDKLLQIDIPLRGITGTPVAYLRFFRDPSQFLAHQRQQTIYLFTLGLLAIGLTVGITTLIFLAYDRKLTRNQRILRAKNQELLNAQRHLLLSSQMTAIGSMTAHLIHDLKSYSNRLNQSLRQLSSGKDPDLEKLEETAACAAQLDLNIRQFLGYFRSETSSFQATYQIEELLEILEDKIQPVAEEGNVQARFSNASPSRAIDFKRGNFLLLIVQNLLHNAIETTPANKEVMLKASLTDEVLNISVIDQGSGIPRNQQKDIFLPKNSFKVGGTGLGLAISAQMASHINAKISLARSDSHGSEFKVSVPISDQANLNEADSE